MRNPWHKVENEDLNAKIRAEITDHANGEWN
jgi:hypothetical protein